MKNVIFYLLILIPTYLFAQPVIQWQHVYGGSGWDIGGTIAKRSGGFMVSGTSTSTDVDVTGNHGNFDAWSIWLDDAGGLVRSKCYGGSFGELPGQVACAPGGYIQCAMGASSNGDLSLNHGDYDFWIFKIKESGSLEWQKSLGGSNIDQARSVINTADLGYMVAGNASSTDHDVVGNHGLDDYWVVKMSPAGNVEWQRSLGGSGTDKATSVIQTTDGGYVVAGASASADGDVTGNHGSSDFWIVKLSATGDIVWQRSLGGSDVDEVSSIQQTPDGGYIVSGITYSASGDVTTNHGLSDMWVVKLTGAGAIEWQRSYGGSSEDQAIVVRPVSGGDYILLGSTLSTDGDITGHHGGSDIWMAKLSPVGAIIWQKCLGGSLEEYASDVIEVGVDDYMVVGTSTSSDGDLTVNYGGFDYWVVKLKCGLNSGLITGDSTVCEGGMIVLTDTALGGVWSTSGSGATVTGGLVGGVSSGTTTVSYTMTNACGTTTATHEVTVYGSTIPVVAISGNLLTAPTGFTSYQWFKDGAPIVGAIAGAYLVTSSGSYCVKVINTHGCPGTSPDITMTPVSVAMGISVPDIQVVPNPARTSISILGLKAARLEVFNSVGAAVLHSDEAQDIRVGHLPAGVYYISVFDAESQLVGRCSFVKE